MALSNAERQRRYRQRLKALALAGRGFAGDLDKAYAEGRTVERERLLPLLRQKARALSPEVATSWAEMEEALESPARSLAIDYWKQYGRELGQHHEELFLTRLLRECIGRSNASPMPKPAGPRKELLPRAQKEETPRQNLERDREEQLKMADRFEQLMRRGG